MKGSLRVDFTLKTKKLLAERAGLLCSHFDCLRPTIAPSKNRKGDDSAVGTGVAAHIYAASANGPRPPEGMTEEKIKDQSNGTWMCKLCSDQIDNFRHEYPAERILEMKRVREFAQHFSVTQSDAAYIVGWMGVKRLDLIVRDHLPDLDSERIRRAMLELGKHFIGENLLPDRSILLEPPSYFIKKALPAMIRKADREVWKEPSIPKEVIENRWALEIAREFNAEAYETKEYNLMVIGESQVCLSSRCPSTGILSDVRVHKRATVCCRYNPKIRNGDEIVLLVVSGGGVAWTYRQLNDPKGLRINSKLRLGSYLFPKTAEPKCRDRSREDFESYASWIDELSAGHHPVGQIGLRRTDGPVEDNLHPGVFDIEMNVQLDRLQAIREKCARVRLAYEIADKWDIKFALNNYLLEPLLPLDVIREAVSKIMQTNPGSDRVRSEPLLMSKDGSQGLVLSCVARKVVLTYCRNLNS